MIDWVVAEQEDLEVTKGREDMRRFRSPLRPIFDALNRRGQDPHSNGEGGGAWRQWGLCLQMAIRTLTTEGVPARVEAVEDGDYSKASAGSAVSTSMRKQAHIEAPYWKRYNSRYLGIKDSMIPKQAWFVLGRLQAKGGAAYLVGGCVRDLILNKTPKDFDVITSADPPKIRKCFSKCYIVGKRFPICQVYVGSSMAEVASFGTFEKVAKGKCISFPQKPSNCGHHDYVRWKDCMQRDFTINGLMYDPFANLVYDYIGGMKDLKMAKVRTIIPAHASFEEDSARILRAFRVAGRLRFQFTNDTACAIQDLAHSIVRLDKQRLMMEMNYILAYGAAEASLRLLTRFKVLDILLPFQAAYFSSQGSNMHDERCGKQSNMLLALFANLDKLLASDRPCHRSLWVGLLAFHLALVNKPQDVLLVTAFSFSLYYGECSAKAISAARNTIQTANRFCPEIVEAVRVESDKLLVKEVSNLASEALAALDSMVNIKLPSPATSENPHVPFSDLVFISKSLYAKVAQIFGIEGGNEEHKCHKRECLNINYESLANGDLEEVQFVFAKVVLGTLYSDFKDPL